MKKRNGRNGLFIVVEGLDGIGKGVIERALIEYEQKEGKAVFDTVAFSKANRKGMPELKDFWNPPETYYDTIITAEPTYSDIGHAIRNEMIFNNGREYSAETTIQAYSLDRLMLTQRVGIPALQNGLTDIRSRCMASTLVYQVEQSIKEKKDPNKIKKRILAHEGSKLQLEWAPDLMLIATIDNAQEVIERLKKRKDSKKDDKSIFDNIKFQSTIKPLYEGDWLKKLFEDHGTTVKYLDAGISEESTKEQAVNIYKTFLENR